MSTKTTRKADHARRTSKPSNPPGLLQFFPLGTPPEMQFIVLGRGQNLIGRAEYCAIHIDDDEASREHARIELGDKTWQITDCDSTNGVYINGQRVDSRPLSGGEIIRIGSTFFRFLSQGTVSKSRIQQVQTTGLVGGPALDQVRDLLNRAATSDMAVLIIGETGTGKELAAQHLHQARDARQAPFVPVNCAAIPAELLESELFGHVKGAFSGAIDDAPGLIRQADGGTLFLDEIGELPMQSQAKLLRVLQDHRVRPVGGTRVIPVDVRVICATNRDLSQQVQDGEFRVDLYARISELQIHLPSLAQKVEDIPLLAQHFVAKHGRGNLGLPVEVVELLCCQKWPYNVRQLESAIRRAILMAGDEPELRVEHFHIDSGEPRSGQAKAGDAKAALEDPMAVEMDRVLRDHEGDVERAASSLGISRSQLYRRAQKFGIDLPSYRR